ncbi:MAG TPA: cytochrome c oxidase subunit I [Longimicrobiales bacterium]|nr:cytochrome c oxidase subunit I [Longimicrobiales bacterium]
MATAQATVATPTGYRSFWHGDWRDWMTTVDHKKIGVLYGVSALFFMVLGGLAAVIIRTQLAVPENELVSAELYNQLFTMHGVTMVFLFGMPMAVALFNFLIPLQIGARDVAFPRLNALSYWIFLLGGLFMYSSFLVGAAPNGGWFGYANLSSRQYSPGLNMDFYSLGLQILGVASIMGGVNFITTIINMRAPGMRLMRMPLFTWMAFVTSFLIITALPVLAVALFMLTFDRTWGTVFFEPGAGGDPVMWQHLFWIFGHPEVYILILPAFGIISEILPTFSRKPLFGYSIMVYSGVLIGLIGWGVWAHHMFTTGMGAIADAFFTVGTMIIAIPTGVKIFNWLATMWGGQLRFTTAMKYAIGAVATFTFGGVSGIMHATSPHDLQQHDTYFVVAHFHYVLFGGLVLAVFGAFYYWWPKLTGKFLSEKIGTWQFWSLFLGFNITFFPQHFIGLLGMPRRVFTYSSELGLGGLNMASTVGAYLTAIGVLLFFWNVIASRRSRERATPNPWGAATLEWGTESPPPAHNFNNTPVLHSREPLWHEAAAIESAVRGEQRESFHMPSGSWWPLFTAVGIVLALALFMAPVWWAPLIGLAWTAIGVVNFAFEPT